MSAQVTFLDLVFHAEYGKKYNQAIPFFPIKTLNWVPAQQNGDDCGVFVMNYMEFLDLRPGSKFMVNIESTY